MDFSTLLPPLPAGARYVRRTLYLRWQLARQFRKLAARESWELADLGRVLIMMGLAFRELHDAEADVRRKKHRLFAAVKILNALTPRMGGGSRRPYRMRIGSSNSVWITVHLPAGFLTHVAKYARMNGRSQNDALTLFLRDGLLLYLYGYSRFLKAQAES